MPVPIVPCPDCSARLFTVQCSAFRIEMELERVLPTGAERPSQMGCRGSAQGLSGDNVAHPA